MYSYLEQIQPAVGVGLKLGSFSLPTSMTVTTGCSCFLCETWITSFIGTWKVYEIRYLKHIIKGI